MISGIFHQGSGLGNQLHRYVATRVLALDKDCSFSMIATENFKGKSFMNLELNEEDFYWHQTEDQTGKVIPVNGKGTIMPVWEEKTNYYNPEFNFIEDSTIIDGEFQDERYFGHRMEEINEWLKVEPLEMPDDVCVINFRGGEYALYPDLFLSHEYWEECINRMTRIYSKTKFEVHTDDPVLAARFFPNYPIIKDIGINWRSIRYAKNLILSNSSFGILPALLNEEARIIQAPRYWARRNTKEWSMPQNYYKSFQYV